MSANGNEQLAAEQNTWNSSSILIPAQFTNPITGEFYQTEINLAEYVGKESPYAHEGNKQDPFMAEHLRLHVFPEITDDSKESVRFIIKNLVDTCAKDDGFAVFGSYDRKQFYLVFKCKRGSMYKSRKSADTPAAKRPRTTTFRPMLEEQRCRCRFGFVFRDSKWHFNTGSGILSHCYHARQQYDEEKRFYRFEKVPTEPVIDRGSDNDSSSDDEGLDPVKRGDRVIRKDCRMTEAQWENGHEHWKDPEASTSQTFDFLWNELCEMCDDSYRATAVMQKHLARAIAECRTVRQQDPNRKSVATSDDDPSLSTEGLFDL